MHKITEPPDLGLWELLRETPLSLVGIWHHTFPEDDLPAEVAFDERTIYFMVLPESALLVRATLHRMGLTTGFAPNEPPREWWAYTVWARLDGHTDSPHVGIFPLTAAYNLSVAWGPGNQFVRYLLSGYMPGATRVALPSEVAGFLTELVRLWQPLLSSEFRELLPPESLAPPALKQLLPNGLPPELAAWFELPPA